MIDLRKKGKDISVMVWGAISKNGGMSDLIPLERDFESKKNGYSANSYIAVLEEALPTI